MIQANTNNRWARLSQSEKAELLGIYASKGYHDLANIIAHYNSCGGKLFDEGGYKTGVERGLRRIKEEASAAAGSAEEYIKRKLEEIRAAALQKSRTRTMPAVVGKVPMSPERRNVVIAHARNDAEQARRNAMAYAEADSKHWGEAFSKYGITSSIEPFKSDDRSQREHARLAELRFAKEKDDFANDIESGKVVLTAEGFTCLNTATDNYGPQYRVSGNQTFASNPAKYGFIEMPVSEIQPGDIVQALDGGVPDHAMIYDGKGEDGYPRFNYSKGGIYPEEIVVHGSYYGNLEPEHFKSYRFVGTPADSLKWKQEWETQNGFTCGGKLFDNGGDTDDDRKVKRGPISRVIAKRLFGNLSDEEVRRRLYDNLSPWNYNDPIERVRNAVSGEREDFINNHGYSWVRDDIFATYLGIPQEKRHRIEEYDSRTMKELGYGTVVESAYKPTIGNENGSYYAMKSIPDYEKSRFVSEAEGIPVGKNKTSNVLSLYFGTHTLGHGVDPIKGDYVSYYDLWDLDPGAWIWGGQNGGGVASRISYGLLKAINNGDDMSLGIGNPVNFYDRIYLDDYYGVDSRPQNSDEYYGGYLVPSSVVVEKKNNGGYLFGNGGPITNTAQYKGNAYLYNPPVNVGAPIEVPLRYKPLPDYGDYVPQRTTGMLEDMPIIAELKIPQRGYGILMPDVPSATPALDARQDAARRIMAVENSKNNVNGGYDAKTGRWYPHKSHEGGADTIAYGIKLSNGTPEAALALKQGYLTDEQAESAVDSLVQKYYDAAKRVYDERYGAGEWDKLSDKSQSILVDYSYNPGLAKFPKLMEGFHSGNLDLIRKNYKRYSGGKELGRNKVLLEELDTLENEYPIFRAEGGKIHIKPENYFGNGGPGGWNIGATLLKRAKDKYLSDYAKRGYVYSYPQNVHELISYGLSPYIWMDDMTNYVHEVNPKEFTDVRRALFAKNFDIDLSSVGLDGVIEESKYRPSVESNNKTKYYTVPGSATERFDKLSASMGHFKRDSGEDERGKYYSIYDIWDLSPFSEGGNDFSLFGANPVEIYDRFYEDELPDEYIQYLDPEKYKSGNRYEGMSFKSGGSIHIKPENRGKFTALKKRTGHSASWFKAHGTPAQKKMAVFALNAKKWKHEDGGPLQQYADFSGLF